MPREPGLAAVLEKQANIEQAIDMRSHRLVSILPAGKLKTNPHKLTGNGTVQTLLKSLRARFKYIVVDTAPILGASESLVWANAADGTLMCVMRERSRVQQVLAANYRIQISGGTAIGAVLNGVSRREYKSSYGRYNYLTE